MQFICKFFDGKHSASKICIVKCDEKLSLRVDAEEQDFLLENVSWKKTEAQIFITSENLGKYAYIVVENPDDQAAILKFLRSLKTKSIWYSHAFCIYYGIISILIGLWVFMDSLIFLFPANLEPWLEKQVRAIHFRKAKVIASSSSDVTLKKIQRAFVEIQPELDGVEITIIEDDSVNAVTLPNKKIMIYSKLIESTDSIEELMGIIAHEMAHVKHRHCIAAYVKLLLFDMGGKIVLGGFDSGAGMLMHFLQFSRAAEMQADEGAIIYLRQLALSTAGMSTFFKKMKEKEKSKYYSLNILSTHPCSQERQQLFEEHRKEYEQSVFSDMDLKNIKEILQKLH